MLNMVVARFLRVLIALPLILAVVNCGYAETASDAAVKTAFLYNFFKFIEWPVTAGSDKTYRLCSTDSQSLGDSLMVLQEKTVNGRQLQVRRGVKGNELKNCQMVFIDAGDNAEAIVRELQNLPIVTVSDVQGFVDSGGMIGLVADNNRLSFAVNLDAATAGNIHINAQLLKLAKTVHTSQ